MKQTPIQLLRLIFVSALVIYSFLPGIPASFADDQAVVSEDASGDVEARTFHEDTDEAVESAAQSGIESPGVQTNISPRQSTSSSDADSGKTPHMTYSPEDESDYDEGGLTRTQVSGTYRLAAGVGRNRTFSVNDANSDLDDRDFHFLFGDRRENTYNPNIYSQYKLDIDSQINKSTSFYAQLVADPWSYVGKTSEIVVRDQANSDNLRFQLKYWGPNNSTVPVSFRTPNRGAVSFGDLQADSGYTTPTQVRSFDFGVFQAVWDIPAQEIDYEFRPLRKMWVDVEGDI
ncbi:MAG: hypothetical protein KC649_00500, partial [Candidatus Omnitrophica bacterium]|nr:hypothetical protein [Candidatus Omnitrophota bacterium]